MLGEARKRFKTYVNILSTIKNENNEKYLILRKRYYNECPVEYEPDYDLKMFGNPELLQSPGSRSGISEHDLGSNDRFLNELQIGKPVESSPYKEPPPYKPPPKVVHPAYQNQEKYGECIDEFKTAISAIDLQKISADCGTSVTKTTDLAPELPLKLKFAKDDANYCNQQLMNNISMKNDVAVSDGFVEKNENKENESIPSKTSSDIETEQMHDKQISVKEATKKFNRIASEEEASKILSPTAKKRPEKVSDLYVK